MDKAEAGKLNDKIQAIYEKPLREISLEEMDEAVIELIICTFHKSTQQVSREKAMDCVFDYAKYLIERIENPILPSIPVGIWFTNWWKTNQENKQ